MKSKRALFSEDNEQILEEKKPEFRIFLPSSRQKILNDPIHGYLDISTDTFAFIDTPQYQRLRDLKQLGTLYYIFPGASHNRFEHGIGVSHLSKAWITKFGDSQPELEITEREKHLIEIAGLCHDLGHGPFSHVFDRHFIPMTGANGKWSHEDGSVMMLKSLIDENSLDYDKYDFQFLTDLIQGHCPSYDKERSFLYEIVANYQNSIDVDKFDYLARDCHNLQLKYSYDSSRLMKFSRVIDGEICFHIKEAYNLYEMFHTRYTLHKLIYSHRVSKCVEYQICDCLLAADKSLGISDSINDPSKYVLLTDCILREIERSTSDELKKSREILKNIRKRKFYKFVEQAALRDDMFVTCTASDLLNYQDGNTLQLEDIIVDDAVFNYAMKDRNPVDNVYFYRSNEENIKFKTDREAVSLLIPSAFQERYVTVFARDETKVDAIRKAFTKWRLSKSLISSPYKK